jgi:polar amino acid transport system permease protein
MTDLPLTAVDDTRYPADDAAPAVNRTVPVRRPGRWASAAVLLVLAAMLVNTVLTNPRFQWDVVGHYLTAEPILHGLVLTLELTVVAMALGIVLGVVLAVMRLSENPVARTISWLYVGFFRGTPVLVQVIFWFNLSALFPRLSLGVPFGPEFLLIDVNTLITPFMAAALGLGLNEGAYMAEIVRSGILSIQPGQREAATALGLSRGQTMRRIVLPQAMRVIIPPSGNELVGMLKATSLVSVIALSELLYSAQAIYSQNYQTIPLLIVASLWYLVVTTVLTVAQGFVEKHFSRGSHQGARQPFQLRLLRALNPIWLLGGRR